MLCSSIILIGILIDSVNKYRFNKQDPSIKKQASSKWLSSLTSTALIAFLLHSSIVSLIRLDVYPNTDSFCKWLAKSFTAFYHFTRCILYAVLVCRVQVSFRGSTYEYNRKYIILPLYAMIVWWMVCSLILDILFVGGHYDHHLQGLFCIVFLFPFDIYTYKHKACAPDHVKWGVLLSGSIDLCLSVISVALFVLPLTRLNKRSDTDHMAKSIQLDVASPGSAGSVSSASASADSTSDGLSLETRSTSMRRDEAAKTDLGALILRYGLLVQIAIASTFFMHVGIFLWPGSSDITLPIDHMVNAWCIVLLRNVNKKLYRKMCYLCHGAMKMCWG